VVSKTAGHPYPGPRPFQQSDRGQFFGRATDAVIVSQWWRDNRLTFVVDRAGQGKTSLLNAGVLPLLADEMRDVLPVGRLSYGAAFPSAALPVHNPYTLALLRSWAPGDTATRLARLTVREFFAQRPGDDIVLAAIDPADELLADAGPRWAHRRLLLGDLKDALEKEPRLHLLVTGREEAISVMTSVLGNGARYGLAALTWQGAVQAVTRPLAAVGRSFDLGAAEKLVTDLQTSQITACDGAEHYIADDHVEPALLQVACARLWDSLPADGDVITVRDVRKHGDVDTALADYCGMVIAQVADDHDLSARRLMAWLLSTFVTDRGARGKAYEGATHTAGMPNTVVRTLADRHLLAAVLQSGSRWYELLSDRLIEPLRKVSDTRPEPLKPERYLRAAEHALTLGALDLADRHAGEALSASSGASPWLQAEAHSLLGNVADDRGKPEEAEVHYREAARLYEAAGDSRDVGYQLAAIGQTLLAQGRVTEAVDELHAAVTRLPSDLTLQAEFAHALWQDGEGAAAVAVLNDVLRVDGGNRPALRARGEILAYLGQARQAMLDLERVPLQGLPSARAARGLALAELGDQSAARREIENALAEGCRNGPVLLYAARAFALGGDDNAARELAQEAADATDPPLSPQHRAAARQLADRWRA
jgi:Flp pilus assembly protein TadD